MTRVSKKKLKKEIENIIANQLAVSILRTRSKKDAEVVINELFTSTEKVMFTKRFAVIAMLVHGYSFTQIQKFLGVSKDTVVRIWKDVKSGKYSHLVTYARNNPKKFEGKTLIDHLETLLRAGVMPPMGKGKWDAIKKMERKSEFGTK